MQVEVSIPGPKLSAEHPRDIDALKNVAVQEVCERGKNHPGQKMETADVNLAPIDSASEMQRVLAADVCNRIAYIIKVLRYSDALAVSTEIKAHRLIRLFNTECSRHYDSRIWVVKGRRHRHTNA